MDNDGSDNSTDVPLRQGRLQLSPLIHNVGNCSLPSQGFGKAKAGLIEVPG